MSSFTNIICSLALLGGVAFLAALVSGRRASGKRIQTEGEQPHISEIALALYRHSE
jgi:hypothetical protein